MLSLEVVGNEDVITEAKRQLALLAEGEVREFHHRGAAGEAGLLGLVTSILPPAVTGLFALLKPLVARDRNLKIVVNGLEITVRDLREASDLIDMLEARGLVPKPAGCNAPESR